MDDAVSTTEAAELADAIIDRVGEAVVAERSFLETVLTGLFARGHVLLEDVPGTGKTLTAIALSDALGLEYSRIQFTPDLLPGDITGTHVFNKETGSFRFQEGPIFADIILADEINRAPPKTQSALLEAMDEGQVTVDGDTYELSDPFFVIATQNPIEQEGTFTLPEAQRDRFIVKTSLGYPDRDGELELIDRRSNRAATMPSVDPVVDRSQVRALRLASENVSMNQNVRGYLVDVARATRSHSDVHIGVSPRGIQRFFEAARARAVIEGRDFVTPDDVKSVARAVMKHRLVLEPEADIKGIEPTRIVSDVVNDVKVPAAHAQD